MVLIEFLGFDVPHWNHFYKQTSLNIFLEIIMLLFVYFDEILVAI